MLRIIFSIIVLIHGLIHLPGFFKEWRLAEVSQLTGKTLIPFSESMSKAAGLLWLAACLIFIASAALYFFRIDWWWIAAFIALILSQALIVIYWHDAKFGTAANIIVLTGCILAYGHWNFDRMVKSELPGFMPKAEAAQNKKNVTEESIKNLPPAVQKWLRCSGTIGREFIHTVHLKQNGQMRTKPDGSWMPFTAEQFFTVDKPGFHWTAMVQASPFINMAGRDKYEGGKGHMLIKLFSLIPVADSKGAQLDQGAMLRYLAEICWFPPAALNSYITWEGIDSLSAKATMSYGGVTASGIFKFNEAGDMTGFEAQRYYDRKEGPTLETWIIAIEPESIKEFNRVRIGAKASVTWRLKTGDFTWAKIEIKDIEYNKATEL